MSQDGCAYVFSDHGVTILRSPQIGPLVALLDGTRDLADLLRDLPEGMDPEQVAELVARLRQAGLVTYHSADGPAGPASAYWDACGVDPDANGRAADEARLITTGATAVREAAHAALAAAGLTVRPGDTPLPGDTGLSVVLCDDYLDPALAGVDAAHRATGTPWLLARPVGTQVWIGPVFVPGRSACWHCLAGRLWRHRHAEECAQRSLGCTGPAERPSVTLPALTAVAVNLVSLEATKWTAGHRYAGQDCVWTLDSVDLQGRRHELRARPQCPHCGDPTLVATRARRPVVLPPARKASRTGGGHRSRTPGEVLSAYQHLVSPVTGIVKDLVRDDRAPAFFHAYRSGPNAAALGLDPAALAGGMRAHSGGKGVTELDARVSALCEALERHSGTFHGDEERIRGSLRSLGEQALHPNDCMLFDERQYATRAGWNAAHGPFQQVPEPFDEAAVTDWTGVWSLTERRHRLLPTGLLYYVPPGALDTRGLRADSNGNAAGSCLSDAVLQGVLELIERDAVAIWWYNRLRVPGVDLASFGDPWIDELRRQYADLGRGVWALDLTSDLGVPVLAAVSCRAGDGGRLLFGFGAHLDPAVALRRALTELNQGVPGLHDAGPEVFDDPDAAGWWRDATGENQPYVLPDPGHRERTRADFAYQPGDDIVADVVQLTAWLAARGLDTLVLDQTRPDVGLPVVKVVVPGLRHIWSRFAPGRLYDVPVDRGHLLVPTRYEDLNPLPLFV
ncbi:TOMM precursor leader peptide-binding protein [Micromonospora yasonensis]|uniref:TOMM precursor leader peptide-binding protein n=1 Tax=Micromonospora yasonensis TaxID=1128667 RepID=UPI00222F4990|nr:TOMM precursor leader peptide-binding protein [Micromonospora yasonensis]MCW3840369.1 TOMM precursor leader peptide-binding protein [Micromonospora yasonensis]